MSMCSSQLTEMINECNQVCQVWNNFTVANFYQHTATWWADEMYLSKFNIISCYTQLFIKNFLYQTHETPEERLV